MTELKNTTQKAKGIIHTYNYYKNTNEGITLFEIYNNYSWRKEKALDYCKELKQRLNGFNSCFCGHNCMIFTYAFLFKEGDTIYLCYITPSYDYKIKYE